jgi:hypothetical protein
MFWIEIPSVTVEGGSSPDGALRRGGSSQSPFSPYEIVLEDVTHILRALGSLLDQDCVLTLDALVEQTNQRGGAKRKHDRRACSRGVIP